MVVLHFLLIPFKVLAITLLAFFHRATLWYRYRRDFPDTVPNVENLKVAHKAGVLMLQKFLVGGRTRFPVYDTNPDHQPLRHGALAWSTENMDVINGLSNYIKDGKFTRGPKSELPASASMSMSVAFGIMTALRRGKDIDVTFKYEFLKAVDALIASGMQIDGDVSTNCRISSSGFDAICALSLLYTAHKLTNNHKYSREAFKILFLKGYALLLLAPVTYVSIRNRNYHVDHISVFGLSTAIHACPNFFVRGLLRHALRFVNKQSYAYANPYLCALAHEVGCLSKGQKAQVLAVHTHSSPMKAAWKRDVLYTGEVPYDFSSQSDPEFIFDDLRSAAVDVQGSDKVYVPLSGLCLSKSLLVLSGESI